MTVNIFPVYNLSASTDNNLYSIDDEIIEKITLAQRDHVSVDFKRGVIRVILCDIANDVEKNDVVDGSFSQFIASYIANEFNLQSHILLEDNKKASLVIVSQLQGPRDQIDMLCDLIKII